MGGINKLSAGIALTTLCLSGCGRGLAGTWVAKVRATQTPAKSTDPNYTLEAVTKRLQEENRTLELQAGGKYRYSSGRSAHTGTWRVDGETLYLNSTEVNGVAIQKALQKEMSYRIGGGGAELISGHYSAYGLEEYYVRK